MRQLFIQGLFFQNRQAVELACTPKDGVVAMLRRGLFRYAYSGILWDDETSSMGGLVGHMQDVFGGSRLSDARADAIEVSFTKRYDNRSDDIRYAFKVSEGGVWFGGYEGDLVGSGVSICVVAEVPEHLIGVQAILAKLGRGTAHEW